MTRWTVAPAIAILSALGLCMCVPAGHEPVFGESRVVPTSKASAAPSEPPPEPSQTPSTPPRRRFPLLVLAGDIDFPTSRFVPYLTPKNYAVWQEVLALMKEHPTLVLRIEGHTDSRGGPPINEPLSQQRALGVALSLVEQGAISRERLKPVGCAFRAPLVDPERSETDRRHNRRVEFHFVELDGVRIEEAREDCVAHPHTPKGR